MKKFSLLVLLCLSFFTFAQQDINETFGQQMATMFAPLDKSKVPNGLLLDISMEFTDVPRFNGTLTDSTYVRPSTLKNFYNTFPQTKKTAPEGSFN